jgi:chromosome segregation ATPase
LNTVAEIREVAPESHLAKDAERLGEHLQSMKVRKVDQPRQESRSEKPAPLPNTGKNKNGASSPAAVLVIAQKDPEAVEAPPAEEKKKEAKAPNEAELKSGLAKTRKALQVVKKKIDADHEAWENSEKEIAGSKARRAELEAALENERVRYKKLLEVVARIEKEHNGDHDRVEELEQELAAREKAWAEFESKQDEITKLEKIAAELRLQAEKLGKRAEHLRKN